MTNEIESTEENRLELIAIKWWNVLGGTEENSENSHSG
jgi:hypothetical protein